MNLLSKLKPAETLLLLDGSKSDFKNLMKFTFMDLVLKQVLVVKESVRTIKSGRGYKEQRTKYVVIGKNFKNYKPSAFERIYLTTFDKSPELKAVLTKLIKVAYDSIHLERKYRRTILNSIPIKQCFKISLLNQLMGSFSLTSEGYQKRSMVEIRLKDIDMIIGDLLKNDQKKALEILIEIGGNIFLLKNIDFELLRNIDKSILESMKIEGQFDGFDNDYGIWYYMDFSDDYWLDSTFDSWDDTFDTFDSGYDSAGCSSCDSGCSSCGGCD